MGFLPLSVPGDVPVSGFDPVGSGVGEFGVGSMTGHHRTGHPAPAGFAQFTDKGVEDTLDPLFQNGIPASVCAGGDADSPPVESCEGGGAGVSCGT